MQAHAPLPRHSRTVSSCAAAAAAAARSCRCHSTAPVRLRLGSLVWPCNENITTQRQQTDDEPCGRLLGHHARRRRGPPAAHCRRRQAGCPCHTGSFLMGFQPVTRPLSSPSRAAMFSSDSSNLGGGREEREGEGSGVTTLPTRAGGGSRAAMHPHMGPLLPCSPYPHLKTSRLARCRSAWLLLGSGTNPFCRLQLRQAMEAARHLAWLRRTVRLHVTFFFWFAAHGPGIPGPRAPAQRQPTGSALGRA